MLNFNIIRAYSYDYINRNMGTMGSGSQPRINGGIFSIRDLHLVLSIISAGRKKNINKTLKRKNDYPAVDNSSAKYPKYT